MHEGFNARAMKALQEPTERTANELVDRRVPHGDLDISEDFGLLLPAYVLADFVGAPREDRDRFVAWSLDFVEFFNEIPITEQATRGMVATTLEMREYFRVPSPSAGDRNARTSWARWWGSPILTTPTPRRRSSPTR